MTDEIASRLREYARTYHGDESAVEALYEQEWPDPVNVFERFRETPFPTSILPMPLRLYVEDQSRRMGVDQGMLAMFGLGICAGALTDRLQVQVLACNPGWRESARLWIAAVGNPSIKKTPALNTMMGPLRRVEKTYREAAIAKKAAYDSLFTVYQAKLKAYNKALANDEAPGLMPTPPPPPEMHRAIFNNFTIEALEQVLLYTDRGTLLEFDELSGFFGRMDAYAAGKGADKDRPAYLQLYNGGGMAIDRVGRGSSFVPNWSASIVGAIQPEPMSAVMKKMRDDGLMQRFNVFLAHDSVHWVDREFKAEHYHAYEGLVMRLALIDGGETPVTMGPEATEALERISANARAAQGIKSLPLCQRTAMGKWEGQFARYLLLFHAMSCAERSIHPASEPISDISAERVTILFEDFLEPNMDAFYDSVYGETELMGHARWLAGFILSRRLDEIAYRDIKAAYRAMREASDQDIHEAMEILCVYGWAYPQEDPKHPRPPYRKWNINPRIHGKYQAIAKAEKERRERELAEIKRKYRRADEEPDSDESE